MMTELWPNRTLTVGFGLSTSEWKIKKKNTYILANLIYSVLDFFFFLNYLCPDMTFLWWLNMPSSISVLYGSIHVNFTES